MAVHTKFQINEDLAPLRACLDALPRETSVVILAFNKPANTYQSVVHCADEAYSDPQKDSFNDQSHESIKDAFVNAFHARPVLKKIAKEALEWLAESEQIKDGLPKS